MTSDDGRRLEVRPYHDDDEDAVAALWTTVFPENPSHNEPRANIRRKLGIQRELFLVATLDGRLVGTALAGDDGHRGWVYYVAVDPAHRRRGIGAAVMKRVEADLARRGCPKLNLQVRAGNKGVVAFYETLGYEVEERVSMGKRLG